jgi:hypothetical protein
MEEVNAIIDNFLNFRPLPENETLPCVNNLIWEQLQ